MKLAQQRPAELVALLALAAALYGWLAERGVPNVIAALVGLVGGAVPLAVSWWRDGRPEPGDPGDNDPEGPPPTPPNLTAERHQLDH